MRELMIFDVDGTLVNTLPHIYRSYCLACEKFKVKEPLLDTLRINYDQSNKFRNTALAIGVPSGSVDEFNYWVYEFFKKEIRENKPQLIPSVVNILYALKARGVDMKILSLELYENTVYKLGEKLVNDVFSEILVPHDGKPAALREIRKKYNGKIIYVGDCVSDGEASSYAEVKFIGLATKFSFSHEDKMLEYVKRNIDRARCAISHFHIISHYESMLEQ
ncbi:MAG: HAD family hydrolase [Candidatus Micrarchaeota archaeon]|nr:HAD family hydrolase [Candidatus Micrarchaeota archaeon]